MPFTPDPFFEEKNKSEQSDAPNPSAVALCLLGRFAPGIRRAVGQG